MAATFCATCTTILALFYVYLNSVVNKLIESPKNEK